jgi:hypothetical protein
MRNSMKTKEKESSTVFAIFGGGGDLAWRVARVAELESQNTRE